MKSLKLYPALLMICMLAFNLYSPNAIAQTADNSDPSPLKFPTPKGIANQLFYVQRDPNINTIICELNTNEDGVVDKKKPVNVYWIRYDEGNEKKDLSYIQRKFAYGVETKDLGNDQYELRFVSYKKFPLYLQKSADDNKYHVYVTVNKKKIQLDRIFLRIEGGSFWIPNVRYVELRGINTANKVSVSERIKV